MFQKMLIRNKILYGTLALVVALILLMVCSLFGVGAYRNLSISIRELSSEIAHLNSLQNGLDDLRDILISPERSTLSIQRAAPRAVELVQYEFLGQLATVQDNLAQYSKRLEKQIEASDPLLATSQDELTTTDRAMKSLEEVENAILNLSIGDPSLEIADQLDIARIQMARLSSLLNSRMSNFRDEVRLRYRSWQAAIVITASISLVIVVFLFHLFRRSVVKPFKVLIGGSKSIANGDFNHRIHLNSEDELADLADTMNDMTDRFVQIRDNLNDQVKQRTQEVVRSEQLASVGFLAAGVAHEINNPLASIAWSAEALESRLHEVLHGGENTAGPEAGQFDEEQIEILRDYLKRIQDEAFRCKGITERLLDFSRLGESQKKQETDIYEAVEDVIALAKHLGQYRNRKIHFRGTPGIHAWVSPTEFKQVVLNLLTNALDASEDGSSINVVLQATGRVFTLRVIDYGCGMTDEVIKHLFEPFFTRRRDGRGTGLGLSITYRIVQDHDGTLSASSPGPGCGSTMELSMPLQQYGAEEHERLQAA